MLKTFLISGIVIGGIFAYILVASRGLTPDVPQFTAYTIFPAILLCGIISLIYFVWKNTGDSRAH